MSTRSLRTPTWADVALFLMGVTLAAAAGVGVASGVPTHVAVSGGSLLAAGVLAGVGATKRPARS